MIKRELLSFIQSSFKSVWSIEVLIFLREHRTRGFTPDELIRELRGSAPVVEQSVAMLQQAGLVALDDDNMVRYAPAAPEIDALSEAAVRTYADSPGRVRRAILSAPNDKLHSLADAFLLKKDRE